MYPVSPPQNAMRHRKPNPLPVPADVSVEPDGGLRIGLTVSFQALAQQPCVWYYPALQMALRSLLQPTATRQGDMRQVLSGEAEVQGLAAALIALDTELFITGPIRERSIGLLKYLSLDSLKLRAEEVITDFYIPNTPSSRFRPGSQQNSNYQSIDYLRSGQAVCGVAVWARKSGDTLDEVRLVLSGCTRLPAPLRRVSAALRGKDCSTENIEQATRKLGEERLTLYNPELTLGSHLFNLSKTLIKRAVLMV